MQKCENCSYVFTWKDIFISLFFGDNPIKCSNCGNKYYVNFFTRIGVTFVAIAIPILLAIRYPNRMFSSFYYLLAYILWFTFVALISPFFAKYHRKQ